MCLIHTNADNYHFSLDLQLFAIASYFPSSSPVSYIVFGPNVIVLNRVMLVLFLFEYNEPKGPIDLLLDNYCFAFLSCFQCLMCVCFCVSTIHTHLLFLLRFIFYCSSTIMISLCCLLFIPL